MSASKAEQVIATSTQQRPRGEQVGCVHQVYFIRLAGLVGVLLLLLLPVLGVPPPPEAACLRALHHVLEAVPAEVGAAEGALHVVAAAVLLDRAVAVRAGLHVDPRHEQVSQVPPRVAVLGLSRPTLCRQGVDVPGSV